MFQQQRPNMGGSFLASIPWSRYGIGCMTKKGFSLLELVVVLAVMGTLAAVAVPVFSSVTDNSAVGALVSSADGIVKSANSRAQSDPLNPGRGTTINDIVLAASDVQDVELLAGDGATSGVRIYGQKDLCINVSITGSASGSVAGSGDPYECLSGSPATTSTTAPTTTTTLAPTTTTTLAPTTTTTLAPTTTTTVASITYNVGDVGPGGGIVFYVHSSGTFASTGSDCGSNCKYLEAAPTNWNGAGGDPSRIWSGNHDTLIGTTGTGLGTGYANTLAAVTQNSTADRVITLAWNYSNNGKTDWHVPSQAELNELCKYARQQTTGNTSVECNNSGAVRSGFAFGDYWSSSEFSATHAWYRNFPSGGQYYWVKSNGDRVRPVRAF